MSVDLPTERQCEPVVSCDTALPCLVQLGVGKGNEPEIEEFRNRAVLDGNTMPASRLIELVGKLGLQAECMRLDWEGLTRVELTHAILVFLKNANAVLVTGTVNADAQAVSVWDPLHSDGVLTVRREDFERAWSGDALVIVWQPSAGAEVTSGSSGKQDIEVPGLAPETDSDRAPMAESEFPLGPMPFVVRAKSRRLVAIGITAVAALSVLFWLHAVTNNVGSARTRSEEQSSRALQTTAEAAARSMVPVTAASAPSGLMPSVVPNVASPALPDLPGGSAAAVSHATAAPPPESVPATAATVPVAAASAATGPASSADPSVATPTQSESPGEPAAAVLPTTAAPSPKSASATAAPATAEPSVGPGVAGPRAAANPGYDAAAEAPAKDPLSSAESRLTVAEAVALVARGDALFGTGDLAAARTFYERAADTGEAQAALRLGETYDPVFLDRAHLRGVRGNVATALSWYRRARDLGAAEAEVLLNSLEAK